jgi:hypothetical protein
MASSAALAGSSGLMVTAGYRLQVYYYMNFSVIAGEEGGGFIKVTLCDECCGFIEALGRAPISC